DLLRNLLRPISPRIGFPSAVVEQKILRGLSNRPYAYNDFFQIRRLARGQLRQAEKRHRAFRFFLVGCDLPKHAQRVGYSTQCRPIQKRTHRQFIATGFESPEAGKQISAVHDGDVAWTQRLESAQGIQIKKMAFETL